MFKSAELAEGRIYAELELGSNSWIKGRKFRLLEVLRRISEYEIQAKIRFISGQFPGMVDNAWIDSRLVEQEIPQPVCAHCGGYGTPHRDWEGSTYGGCTCWVEFIPDSLQPAIAWTQW